jgi:chaperonin GroES
MAELKGKILAGKVLVEPQQAVTKTAGGIIIPDSAKEKPLAGKVVLVGIQKKTKQWKLKLVILYITESIRELKLLLRAKIIF